ncbi:MAG: hypothetical protein CM15mP25_3640 [Gammaproteobacteria bacterium]|nr:MAG: hypothetical protein CM15mP25_3640 [Gammaproteobacteria bacterium]
MQAEVAGIWEQIDTDNLKTLADFDGYRQEFLQLFGFGVDGVDYDADVDPKSRSPAGGVMQPTEKSGHCRRGCAASWRRIRPMTGPAPIPMLW